MRFTPNFPVRIRIVAMMLALAGYPLAVLAASPMLPGLWELRVASTVARQTEPAAISRECLSQKDIDHETKTLPRPDADCALSNITTSGNRTTYDIACKRDEFTNRGRMELVTGSTTYDGMADMKISAAGKTDTPMTVIVNAKRIGDCQK
jgi:hypothetical protein